MRVVRSIMRLVRKPARSRNLFGHHPEDVARDDLFDAVPTGQMKPRGAGIGLDEEPVPDEGAAESVESDELCELGDRSRGGLLVAQLEAIRKRSRLLSASEQVLGERGETLFPAGW